MSHRSWREWAFSREGARSATPRRVILTPGPSAPTREVVERVEREAARALLRHLSDSELSAESRYEEEVGSEVGYEPGPEQVEPWVDAPEQTP